MFRSNQCWCFSFTYKGLLFMAIIWKAFIKTHQASSKCFLHPFPSKPAFQYISAKENQESENVITHWSQVRGMNNFLLGLAVNLRNVCEKVENTAGILLNPSVIFWKTFLCYLLPTHYRTTRLVSQSSCWERYRPSHRRWRSEYRRSSQWRQHHPQCMRECLNFVSFWIERFIFQTYPWARPRKPSSWQPWSHHR